jgi:site-specific recombinase XerD
MRNERGLSEATIEYRRTNIQKFINLIAIKGYTLNRLSVLQLEAILIQKLNQRKYARSTLQTFAYTLRAFLLYAQKRGLCQPNISDAIKLPRVYKHASLPSSPTWNEVKCLIKTTETDCPADIRARAILLLFAVYGLRASEVARLKLDDLNWENETIHITHSKGGHPHNFPLNRSVGQAIIRYLKEVRHRSAYREVFLTTRAPFRPLNSIGLFTIVSLRWKLLNISIPHHGPHSLRHACATRLINHGISLKAIADQLGHRDMETTRIYAKVDLSQLRKVANFNMEDFCETP